MLDIEGERTRRVHVILIAKSNGMIVSNNTLCKTRTSKIDHKEKLTSKYMEYTLQKCVQSLKYCLAFYSHNQLYNFVCTRKIIFSGAHQELEVLSFIWV